MVSKDDSNTLEYWLRAFRQDVERCYWARQQVLGATDGETLESLASSIRMWEKQIDIDCQMIKTFTNVAYRTNV
jgi:hypothetical protein